MTGSLPAARARIPDEKQARVVRLSLLGHSQAEIARMVGLNRRTVKRVLDRVRPALAITCDTTEARSHALLMYREVQRAAWIGADRALERQRSPAAALGVILTAQTRIDALLGIGPVVADDPALLFARFRSLVIDTVRSEAPAAAAAIAARLWEPDA
jgi:hypothetical protein